MSLPASAADAECPEGTIVWFGGDAFVARFVANRLRFPPFKDFTALGVVKDKSFLGGVVYHDYRGHDVQVSLAFDEPKWATRPVLDLLFGYAFRQLACVRMTAMTSSTNTKSVKLLRALGFKHEGTHPNGMNVGDDAVSYGMQARDCRWLRAHNG